MADRTERCRSTGCGETIALDMPMRPCPCETRAARVRTAGEELWVERWRSKMGDACGCDAEVVPVAMPRVVITELELLPHVDFDGARVRADLERPRPGVEVIELSARTGADLDALVDRLDARRAPA